MADEDDVPEEFWDMLDNIEQNKQHQSISTQAPAAALQQYKTATNAPVQQYQQHGLPIWRPGHVQQLPLAPSLKPPSLAQQLAGSGNFIRSPAPGMQQAPNLSNGLHRYGNQHQQPAQHQQQPWGGPHWAQQQHRNYQLPHQPMQQAPEQQIRSNPLETAGPAAAAGSAQQVPASDNTAVTIDASVTAAAGSNADQLLNEQATQALTPRKLQQEVEKLRRELAAHAGTAMQLRSKLTQAEQERQQLQQRVQQQHHPMNSIAQHTAQDLRKQVDTMQQRLMFAEQELSEAHKKAKDKELKATEVEIRFNQLQEELRKRDEQMLQMQFELEQEKQRAERWAANPAVPAAAAAPGTSADAAQSRPSQTAAGASGVGKLSFSTPSSSSGGGRKRRFNAGSTGAAAAAAGTPLSPCGGTGVRRGSGVGVSQQQITPLQQHQLQMQHLLQGRQSASIPQQQQQQQQMLVEDPGLACEDIPEQQLMQVAHEVPPQQHRAVLNRNQIQQQQQPALGMIKLLNGMKQCQIQAVSLSSALWCSCKSALQQLLQPLASQLPALPNTSSSGSGSYRVTGSAADGSPQQAACNRVLLVLAAVQQQLQSVLAGTGSSGSGAELLLQLLRLAAVLFPLGGLGVGESLMSSSNVGVAAQLAAAAAVGDNSSSHKWVLQQPDSWTNAADMGGLVQFQQQILLFQAVDEPQLLHVLPLQLAIAVLQLLQGLLLHDSSCLALVAAAVGASQVSHRHELLGYDNCPLGSNNNTRYTAADGRGDASVTSTATATSSSSNGNGDIPAFLSKGGSYSRRSAPQDKQAAAAAYWTAAEATVASVVRLQHGSSSSNVPELRTSEADKSRQSEAMDSAALQCRRTLFALLADACRSHAGLHAHVGALLAALAARLPVTLQQLLLPAVADSSLVIQLLHSEGYEQRCQAVAVLQQMLVSSAVAAAFTAALGSSDSATAAGVGAPDATAVADSKGSDVPMPLAPLQPCNRGISYTQRSNRAAAKAAVAAAFQEKPQQQQQQQQQHDNPALSTVTGSSQLSYSVTDQAVYDVLYGLLECIAAGIGDLPRHSDNPSSSCADPYSSSSGTASWGMFELQRRACATVAVMLQTKQEALLQVMLDLSFTPGFGLAQRLLALVEAACSAEGGDPFAAATPAPPPSVPAAAAAAAVPRQISIPAELSSPTAATGSSSQADGGVNSVTGTKCKWMECLERVRVAHESLLLLRALMATGGAVGHAATADICSNMTSIRMVQTTRAKLSEWSEAVLSTAAAAVSQGGHLQCSYTPSTAAAAAAVAAGVTPAGAAGSSAATAGLPIAPWAWSYSSSCGCRDKYSSNTGMRVSRSSGPVLGSVAEHVLRLQRPLLRDCFQEISSAAASVHRRAIQYLC